MAWRSARRPWRLFGIPIVIDQSWFFIAAWSAWVLSTQMFPSQYRGLTPPAYWVMGIGASLLLFTCVLLHELGHSLAARRYGIQVTSVTLFIFGGVAQMAGAIRRPRTELIIALAGPVVSVVIALGCMELVRILPVHTPTQLMEIAILRYLAVVNTMILFFNLLPGFPLDGGRVLRAALWAISGNLQLATRIASGVGAGFGLGLMGLGAWVIATKRIWFSGLWYLFLGFFLWDAAQASCRQARGSPG